MLALGCVLPLAGCPSRSHAPADAAALARTQSPLAWRVNHARVTHHLATASLESRDAMPGHQFVVLDVSVRNRDVQPQVLSEGKLIALDEAKLQTFDQPETLLSDEYLSLQVLAPAQAMHGKIAYEVPDPLAGVLYWSPGNGSERILLNPLAMPATTSALADADDDDDGDTAADARIEPADDATVATAVATKASVAKAALPPQPPAPATTKSAPKKPTSVVARQRATAPSATIADVAPDEDAALVPTPVAAPQQVAMIAAPPPAAIPGPVSLRPVVSTTPSPDEREQARRTACADLVARDDPADKARSLGFFAQSCRDFTLPAHWRPQPAPRRSLFARASALLSRIVVAPHVVRLSDCSTSASHADSLVCADPQLSAMDQQLAQSVARARDQVDDPVALQREQEQWRGRVRNACDTARCLQQAYGSRIAQLDALAPMRP